MTPTERLSQMRALRVVAVLVMGLGLGVAVPSCEKWVGSGVEGVLTSCDPLFPVGDQDQRDLEEVAACERAADREQAHLEAESDRGMYLTALSMIVAACGLVWAVTLTNRIYDEEDYDEEDYDDAG